MVPHSPRPPTMPHAVVLTARPPAPRLDASGVRATRCANRISSAPATFHAKASSGCSNSATTIAQRVVGSLGALALFAAPSPAFAAQPIEWVFSGGSEQSIGDILKDSLAESGIEVKRDAKKPSSATNAWMEGKNATAPTLAIEEEKEKEPIDVGATALKFGKLGAILVFADVVTFLVMGRSVMGIMDDGGEDGWKEKMADDIMERANVKKRASEGGGVEKAEEDRYE